MSLDVIPLSSTIGAEVRALVWQHADGRRSLVIGCHASHVERMNADDSAQPLDELLAWTTQERFVYRHDWSEGDLLIWNNRGMLDQVVSYPLDRGRLMHRTTLVGEGAFS